MKKSIQKKINELKGLERDWKKLSNGQRNTRSGQALERKIKYLKLTVRGYEKDLTKQQPKKQKPDVEDEIKTVKRPVYITVHGQKVLTPKKILYFKYAEGKFFVFGDERITPQFDLKTLKEQFDNKNVLVTLKKRKTKAGDRFSFPIPLSEIFDSRKKRLAVAMMLNKSEYVDWLRDELCDSVRHVDKLSEDDLKEQFLSSLDPKVMISDIKRIIHILSTQ